MSIAAVVGRISEIESTFTTITTPAAAKAQPTGPSGSALSGAQFAEALASVSAPGQTPAATQASGVDTIAGMLFRAAATTTTTPQGAPVAPLADYTISSGYGQRDAIPEAGVGAMFHGGIDLAAPRGTEIRAPFDGTVTYSGWGHPERGNTGWVLELTHADGTQTMYNHMAAASPLEVGTSVAAGGAIGKVGSTGNSSGPHLHLSAWVDGEHVDPTDYFAQRGIGL